MKKTAIISFGLLILVLFVGKLYSVTALTDEYQQDLFDRLNHLRGHGAVPASLEGLDRPICGTSAALEAFINRNRMSSAFKTSAVMDGRDSTLQESYGSPAGHFLIHYDIVGTDAVYKPTLDTLDGGDGVPDYINKIGEIADSVWAFAVDKLGFPAPPSDDFYEIGLDSRYDIYINSLGSAYYGATYSEMLVDSQSATSILVLDNDYNFLPYNEYSSDYRDLDRRLDAVRVTAAHEFFHAIHFGMDWTEWEGDDAMSARIYWWEMTAVWMEEMMYDDVNDYYGYLPAFFNLPWIGLRNFSASSYTLALHPYGSVVFPIFLTERWGDTTIVRKIWENCRDYGIGPQFGEAADDAIFEVSGGTHHLVDAMREFAVWNMFTGSRAVRAPDGIGYSESSNYPLIPDSSMFSFDAYPLQVKSLRDSIIYSAKRPEVFGTNYLKFDNLFLIPDSFSLYFYRPLMYKDLDWNVSLIGLPINDAAKAIVQMDLYDAPLYERYVLQNSEDLFKVFTLVTPVTTLITEDNYQDRYDYAFIVLDSSDTIPSPIPYNFKAPYPNPCTACDSITFKVEKSPMDNGPLELEVIIFNSAGEKIIELSTDTFGAGEIAIAWDIKNESGYPVSSGVYLVYWRLSFPGIEDMPEVIHKSKLAILK